MSVDELKKITDVLADKTIFCTKEVLTSEEVDKTIMDALKLIEEDRVNIVASADYSNNKTIDKYVKSIIDKIKLDNHIKKLEIK